MTARPKTYRCISPMIQILGHVPFSGRHQVYDRHLRLGDAVPEWVPDDEIQRLLESQLIEVAA
jgi:hypothetical protein